jgi:4-amino-4-deoxy-L-arabinose transferase-like glycosyltransferase
MRSQPLGGPSSHWTTALADQWFLIGVFALTLFHFWLSAVVPLSEDEVYYWAWAQALGWSYFDHPPLVAYLIAFSTKIFGNSAFGIRFFASIFSLLVLLILRRLVDRAGLLVYLMLTPLFLLGAVLMTPDIPLLFFWTVYLVWFLGLNQTLSGWSDDPVARVYRQTPIALGLWILGGALLGLGFLGKYTMLLAVPCGLAILITRYRWRAWAAGYFVHLVVALGFAMPVLMYNIQHQFAPVLFQWNNALVGSGFSLARMFENLGGQIVLVGALPFLFLPWVLVEGRELREEPRLGGAYSFFVLPIFFFWLQSFRTKLEANWSLVAYLSFWPLAQRLIGRSSFRVVTQSIVIASFIPPLLVSAALLVHLVFPLKWITPSHDRVGKFAAQLTVASAIAADVKQFRSPATVFATTYQWVAYLRYRGVSAEQIHPFQRESHFTIPPVKACEQRVIFLVKDAVGDEPSVLRCFSSKQLVKNYPTVVRGETVATYQLIKYWR